MLPLKVAVAISATSLVLGCSSASVAESTLSPTANSTLDGEPLISSSIPAIRERETAVTVSHRTSATLYSTRPPMRPPTQTSTASPPPTAVAAPSPTPENNTGAEAPVHDVQVAAAADVPSQSRVHGVGDGLSGAVAPPAEGGTQKSGFGASGQGTENDLYAKALPDKGSLKYPNLGSRLSRLVASVEEGLNTAKEAAEGSAIYEGGSIAVTIHLSSNVNEVVLFLEKNGGDPRNVGEDYIEAYVPVTLLGPVSQQSGVIRVREIVPTQVGRVVPASPH